MTLETITKRKTAVAPGSATRAPGSIPEPRRRQLIDATITAIATHGLSRTTLAKVAGLAGMTAGSVNFHFTSKEALLVATLESLVEEHDGFMEAATAKAGADPADALEALIEAQFDPVITDPRKVAVWYAFWSESRARRDYMRICGGSDRANFEACMTLCRQIIEEGGPERSRVMDAPAVTRGLTGLVETLWSEILTSPEHYDREAAKRLCRAYLASVFPWRFEMPEGVGVGEGAPAAPQSVQDASARHLAVTRRTLPAWVYDNAEFTALEREAIFRPAWHVVCHVSELPEAGSYVALDLLGERAFVLRGKDGELRAFHNVCRHRAHAVVQGRSGRCPGVLQCPYHGWTYNLDGTLKAVAHENTFAKLDKPDLGLKAIELEIFLGFVFVRFEAGGPGVAERMAPYAAELAHYRLPDMRPHERVWNAEIEVDWKNVWDNYLEGYHFATGHPGLSDLMGQDYDYEAGPHGTARLSHAMRAKPCKTWSARHYRALLPEAGHLPEGLRRRWSYFFLFPGMAFDIYPDRMDFFRVLPSAPGKALLCSRSYALPDERRETRAARYLNSRLNTAVQDEDNSLTLSVQQGLASSSYTTGVTSDTEVILNAFQDWVREALPVAGLDRVPAPGTVAARNRALAAGAAARAGSRKTEVALDASLAAR
ncbi:MAG: Rieske 2Fe-2S domain-containing protein, partial [Alphaproteobacteria bacterium]|nr:Rieske 2Fe-2S domain-containing protein [Alphaproteobacteria bacterium]